MNLLIATSNAGKVREFSEMLAGQRFICQSLADFPALDVVEETGHTFRSNAVLKASGYAKATGQWTLADDSGLEVDALNLRPGIHSARWAEMHHRGKGDADNNALLLEQLADVPTDRRTARFVCVLALSNPQGQVVLTARDTVDGRILFAPVGGNGFGYDPLFYVEAMGRTTAELPPEQKHAISHRGKALRQMKALVERNLDFELRILD